MTKGPTKPQIKALEVTERMTSILSLLGCSFIIFTFLSSRAFHKPINRLVFFASFGNVVTNIATLISTSGVEAGVKSPLCQTQAFIIQMYVFSSPSLSGEEKCSVHLLTFGREIIGSCRQIPCGPWRWRATSI